MFRQLIVGVDGGPSGRDAAALGRLLLAPDGRLALAHVHTLTPVRGASGAYGPLETAESRELLERERAALGIDAELVSITASAVCRGLHELAGERQADAIVVGSNHRSFLGRVLLGDATRDALVGAPCAVAVAPLGYHARPPAEPVRIGVGYDGSHESDAALAFARDVAARYGASVAALKVIELPVRNADEEELAAASAQLAALKDVEGEVAVGVAAEELAIFGGGVDLLVVGSRGYGPLRTLLFGSTAVALARNARCPLVVLPR